MRRVEPERLPAHVGGRAEYAERIRERGVPRLVPGAAPRAAGGTAAASGNTAAASGG